MILGSALFQFYFIPLFLLAYLFVGVGYKSIAAQLASLIYYTCGRLDFIFIALGSIVLGFYFCFSGHFYVAIGLGLIMVFKFTGNFNSPIIYKNMCELWRRWHIILGRWMEDYLYIPLVGNKSNLSLVKIIF